MKTLVVGGAGFIGSHLCDALMADGHSVACVDDFSLGAEENIVHLQKEGNFTLYRADASESDVLKKIFEKEQPEYVFHLAANSDIQASAKNPRIEYKNTYSSTFEVLNCMRMYGVKKLFFASTSAVYGDKRDELLDESTPNLSPVSYYGAAKLGCEVLINAYTYMNGMNALVFRFPNVVGSRLTHGVIYDFIRKLQKNPQVLEILGDGRQTKPYIYVSDLIEAILWFMDGKGSGVRLYNVGVEGSTSVKRIADMVCKEMGLPDVMYRYTGGEGGWKGDIPRFSYSTKKINSEGWYAKLTSDEAVRKTVRENITR